MTTFDQRRIEAERTAPRILQLWRALQPLQSTIRFMNTGAHPDDETSPMLAALGLRDGFSLSYACSTRGEGGQNDIGTEMTEDLGALRTAEMERAADILDMRLYWLSESPADTIFDFGFSKSGTETLDKWGEDRTLARFVEIIRTEKPDIICPTFLDIPGQHGHHRAMTEAAHRVIHLAADPAFADCTLPPWQVAKLYLPAWSGAGQAYDDDLPPPPATLTVEAKGCDPVSGWSYEHIGQQSRAFHRTQAMGHWVPAGTERDWPLHLAQSHVDRPDLHLRSGLSATIAGLADIPEAHPIEKVLRAADQRLQATRDAFPDTGGCARLATEALEMIRQAINDCPDPAQPMVRHRLEEKAGQLARVIRIGLGVEAFANPSDIWVRPGGSLKVTTETRSGVAHSLKTGLDLPNGWQTEGDTIHLAPEADLHDAYRASYDPNRPPKPRLTVRVNAFGTDSETYLPFVVPPLAMPSHTVSVAPSGVVVNRATDTRSFDVTLSDLHPSDAAPSLDLPAGWRADRNGRTFTVTPPKNVEDGLYHLPVRLEGQPAKTIRRIEHPHTDATFSTAKAEVRIRVLEARLPDLRVGYVGGGNDRVNDWLSALGADVTVLSDTQLQSEDTLAQFDTIIVGIFAFRFRAGLKDAAPRLHRWVEAGGRLVTLYHRPWDNWDPDMTPPRRLEIGQPSLRWRVTDETAKVDHLLPDHPILCAPNRIDNADWAGWHKERGLYFAKAWDDAYTPLLAMADPDEAPHYGALLAADIGRGQHVHTSLILHHQMEKLVPGAFRLMANLIAKPV